MKHYLILTYLTSSSCHQVDLEAKILNIGFNLPHPPIYGNPGQYANAGAIKKRAHTVYRPTLIGTDWPIGFGKKWSTLPRQLFL